MKFKKYSEMLNQSKERTLLTHDVFINELNADLVSDEDEFPRYSINTIEFSYEPMGGSYWLELPEGTQTKPLRFKDEVEAIVNAITPSKDKSKELQTDSILSSLYDLEKVLCEKANKNPENLKDLLALGKQQAYSHVYVEVKNIIKEFIQKTCPKFKS